MRCVVIDYGSGNLRSVAKSLEKVALEKAASNKDGDSPEIIVTNDPSALAGASHIVLPGVGAFRDCIEGLTGIIGMRDALEREVRGHKKPFLGICVGMQMLFESGHEHGVHPGLGWLEGQVVKIAMGKENIALKIPHMGWNELNLAQPSHPLVKHLKNGDHAYFVHSYHAQCRDKSDIVATTDYGGAITAIVARENIMGAQFHPEKSQAAGLQLLRNFLAL